ncbi:hypothetical protein GCM10009566_42860 [Streptomyces murinus]|uniref:Peptidase inhibitor family I36 n=1 Tax=Streptomyces murinus TaxID=33900 RepID=A0A7W3NHZ5_STRMR|nr:peptidase inhibitor family I36 protein [Streptomyces murinus]MBA9050891.1 hypothetical protein [Streptomyces murinus]WSI89807.1 peptidase inhibitor family I36 protein [Streptomyces murinus]
MRFVRFAAATAASAAALAAGVLTAGPAYAGTSYVHNDCTSSDTAHPNHCFRIHFNSRSETTTQSDSACFATRRDRSSEFGYSVNGGASVVRFVFEDFVSDAYGGMPHPCGHSKGDGDGQGVENNAASAWNQDPYAAYSVYSADGYGGENQWYPKADGYARNLTSGIKNHNGAHKRYA